MDFLEEFREMVRENVHSRMVMEDLYRNTDDHEMLRILDEEFLREYPKTYVDKFKEEVLRE